MGKRGKHGQHHHHHHHSDYFDDSYWWNAPSWLNAYVPYVYPVGDLWNYEYPDPAVHCVARTCADSFGVEYSSENEACICQGLRAGCSEWPESDLCLEALYDLTPEQQYCPGDTNLAPSSALWDVARLNMSQEACSF